MKGARPLPADGPPRSRPHPGRPLPDWVTQDKDKLGGTVNRIPSREEIDPIVNEQLVVELYSR